MVTKKIMSKKIVAGIIFAAIIITSVTVVSVLTNSNVFAQEVKFPAQLSDKQEVPPTNSKAIGIAEFTVIG